MMTNDLFKDHLKIFEHKNLQVAEIFKMWYESVNLRFSKFNTSVRVNFLIQVFFFVKNEI